MADAKETKIEAKAQDLEVIVRAWLADFGNTILARNTECYSFVANRCDDLIAALKGQ